VSGSKKVSMRSNYALGDGRGVRRLTVSTSRVLWTFALSSGALLTCSAPLSSQSLIGRTTAELSAGDYVLPRFSPSGRFLVVSQVLADTVTENTQILLLDLGRGLLDTLLPAKAAAKYATYKSYVSDFRWMGDTILHASIPDGDVGVTEVALDVRSRSILHEEHQEGGDEDPLAPYRALADSLGHLYILASHHRELVLTTFSGLGLAGRWSMVGPSFCCRSASPALTMTCGCTGSTDGRLFSFCPLRAACVLASLGDSLRVAISSSQLAPTRSPFTATETRGSRPSSPFL